MKIEVLALLFFFYTTTSAIWFWNRQGPPAVQKRDCIWTAYTQGLCLQVTGKPFPYGRKETRGKIGARGSGKPCTGSPTRITQCSQTEYVANLYLRTVTAALSGGGTSRRTLVGPATAAKKCVADIKDGDGNVVASGRNCPSGKRKKREVIDSLEEMQRRLKREAPPSPPPPGPPPILSTKNRDILFLLDESGSVGSTNFKKIIRMAKALVNSFCGTIRVSKSLTRVGLLSFNYDQHPQIDFDEFFDKATLLDKMDKTKYYGYPSARATCLVKALDFTRTKMLIPGRGARNNIAGTERVVILITDGCANCVNNKNLKSNLQTKGQQFTQDGVPIITFLIADKPGHCFNIMKGLSDGSQCYQQFWAKDWSVFDQMTTAIEGSQCMDAWMIGPSC